MAQLNAEEIYNRYVEDVIRRNDALIKLQKECHELFENKSAAEMLPLLEKIYKEDNEYLAPKTDEEKEEAKNRTLTDNNDFNLFCKNIRPYTILINFDNHPEFLAIKEDIDKAPNEEAKFKIVNSLYPRFSKEIAERKLEDKTIRRQLVFKTIEKMNRRMISDSFFGETNGFKDKGNCTKGITVSLLHIEQEYGISLFSEKTDKESLAHPKDLARELEKYVKSSESGLLSDIPNIQKGDIVLLLNGKGEPRHAIMVSGFDEQGTPLVLGFTGNMKNIPMFESKADGTPRKGIVLDIHSFIKDKVDEHNRTELAQIISAQKKSQSR